MFLLNQWGEINISDRKLEIFFVDFHRLPLNQLSLTKRAASSDGKLDLFIVHASKYLAVTSFIPRNENSQSIGE